MDSKNYSNFSGVVTQATGSWYDVLHEGVTHRCRIRGRLRLKGARSTSPVVVGDIVQCEAEDETLQSYVICGVEPRRNYIIRRASNLSKESHIIGANIDRAVIVVTLFAPETATEFIDRFLITCEAYKVPATILLAKIDLASAEAPEAVEEFHAIYESAGYEVIDISATEGIGLDHVREMLHNHTTLISGNSGVGKSTLIKAIEPQLEIRTGEISASHSKGKHTTTFSTMYPLSDGGYIIDTPGIKGFGLLDIDDEELWHYYPEMMAYGADCQFYNCTHTHEPKCAVRTAVERGEIAYSRYESYLKILDEDDKYRK
ncbi:MAG: ribosome small subunit-dependent GTPase A [Rikenellaceae bacterium]